MGTVAPQDAARLRAEIDAELSNLAQAVAEVKALLGQQDQTTTYALALLLMNYYTGAERLFQRIAGLLGGLPPKSDRWHAHLLDDMCLSIEGIRPAAIQRTTCDRLGALLRLRHVLRNLYAWTIRREDLQPHLEILETVHTDLTNDLARFCEFLRTISE